MGGLVCFFFLMCFYLGLVYVLGFKWGIFLKNFGDDKYRSGGNVYCFLLGLVGFFLYLGFGAFSFSVVAFSPWLNFSSR